MRGDYVRNDNFGIGDGLATMTSSLPCFCPSPHFKTLIKYSSCKVFRGEGIPIRTELLHGQYPSVHLFNKVRIEAGDEPLKEPKAILDLVKYNPQSDLVSFCFDVGGVVVDQRKINPRARMLYPEQRVIFQQLIWDHPEITFVEVGQNSFKFEGAESVCGQGLDKTIEVLSRAKKHIGLHSGVEHLAVAIGIPTCGIINIPSLEKYGDFSQEEMDWISYPQVHRLHSDGGNDKIKELNRENLEEFLNK